MGELALSAPVTGVAEGVATANPEAVVAAGSRPLWLVRALLKNVVFFGIVLGGYWAVHTGYFSSDRVVRAKWMTMERLKEKGRATKVYETSFDKDVLAPGAGTEQGYWSFYNGATSDTASVVNGALEVRYTTAWIGAVFYHTAFEPDGIYRVTFEAKVEQEPAAFLMRNRVLDYLREPVPVTDGFKTFSHVYAAPGGPRDHVRLIFMPDGRQKVSGRITIRKFTIERLQD